MAIPAFGHPLPLSVYSDGSLLNFVRLGVSVLHECRQAWNIGAPCLDALASCESPLGGISVDTQLNPLLSRAFPICCAKQEPKVTTLLSFVILNFGDHKLDMSKIDFSDTAFFQKARSGSVEYGFILITSNIIYNIGRERTKLITSILNHTLPRRIGVFTPTLASRLPF